MNLITFLKKIFSFTAPRRPANPLAVSLVYLVPKKNFYQKNLSTLPLKSFLILLLAIFSIVAIPAIKETTDTAEAKFKNFYQKKAHNQSNNDHQPKKSTSTQPSVTPSPTPTSTPTPTPSPKPTNTPTPTPAPSTTPGTTLTMKIVTFYGWPDNDPPGTAIAFPKSSSSNSIHSGAGGTGTFNDPITFASDPNEFPNGTKLYVPYLKKYVIMEDTCATCIGEWEENKAYHIDIWLNSNAQYNDQVISCEEYWTKENVSIELNPPSNREVVTTPLFNTDSGVCQKTIGTGTVLGTQSSTLSTPTPKPTPKPTPVSTTAPQSPSSTTSDKDYKFTIQSGDNIWRLSKRAVDQLIKDENLHLSSTERQNLIAKLVKLQGSQSPQPGQTYTITRSLLEQAVQQVFF